MKTLTFNLKNNQQLTLKFSNFFIENNINYFYNAFDINFSINYNDFLNYKSLFIKNFDNNFLIDNLINNISDNQQI